MEEKMDETFEKVCDILVDQLGIEKEKIKESSEILTDLGADSLDVVDILHVIEEEFEIKVPDSEIENLKTVGDIVEHIKTLESLKN